MRSSWGTRLFQVANVAFLVFLAGLCILPFVNIVAISFSSRNAAATGAVSLWPVEFTTKAYDFILHKREFILSFGVTLKRVLLGGIINMLLVILAAYPLSKEARQFRARTVYVWVFVFTILFSGGLIPFYMTVRYTGLLDTLAALLLPVALPSMVFNVVLLLNFFRSLPKEMEEAAFIDGAGHWATLRRIYVPMALPALATIMLFTVVFHWNEWFMGLILMNNPDRYPLSSYLQTIIVNQDLVSMRRVDEEQLRDVSDQTAKAAQIVLATIPILAVYPFLQRYFVKGIVLGSLKE